MSEDELLALAVKARDCYGGGAPWERYFAAVKDPAAIIAMHERHRAEVADLIAKMDWNASLWDAAQKSADTLRAEVERLTRERDRLAKMAGGELRNAHEDLMREYRLGLEHGAAKYRSQAESALAAAQKERDEMRLAYDAANRSIVSAKLLAELAAAQAEIGRLLKDLNAAEAVVAAAQKRVGELQPLADAVLYYHQVWNASCAGMATHVQADAAHSAMLEAMHEYVSAHGAALAGPDKEKGPPPG